MFDSDAVADESAPTIPETNIVAWKLHPIDDIPNSQANIDSQILQVCRSLPEMRYNNVKIIICVFNSSFGLNMKSRWHADANFRCH